ncbi:MAG: Mrp/NBP35 family ATP-binding protein [Thermoplasmata archaeon]|nr:Mrp/NBP35 family ATP-binding protein [Thermoplasmata archaeon]MCI4356799.1 Mrp/NBP35 family ATP-binding protein [Thermoplasmata archaeon]
MAGPSTSPPGPQPTSQPPGGPATRGRPGGVLQKMGKGQIAHVVAVGSGKGGVGKSATTALLAAELRRRGLSVGLLDADVTGPSVPKLFGLAGPLLDKGEGIEPKSTPSGIPVVSSQFLVEDEQAPVIWRGPLVTRLIMQFFGGVNWNKLDYLLIDMPPGTSDVPLTVFQTIPIDGMVFVFTPQELAGMIVKKAMNMARDLHVPLLGAVENMSFLNCPHCGERILPFGESGVDAIAREYGVPVLGKLPLDPALSAAADHGTIGDYQSDAVRALGEAFLAAVAAQTSSAVTTL